MQTFDGKVALVTGGSTGIGLAVGRELHRRGARVALFARSKADLDAAVREMPGTLTVSGDVTKTQDLERLYDAIGQKWGKLDVLFVNAGIAEWQSTHEVTEQHFDRLFDVNVKGAFFTVQSAMPLLAQDASIVFNTSVANRIGAARTSVYSATKAAVRSLTRSFATELLPRGIRVNAVSPGPTDTPIQAKSAAGMRPEELMEMGRAVMSRVPMARLARAEEVAQAVVFLASATFITGQELAVDGGLTTL